MGNKYKIGKKIKRRRAYCSFTLQDLSEKTGISVSHLSLIEKDEREPSISCLIKICEALGLSMTHFFIEQLDYDQLDVGDEETITLHDLAEKKWVYPEDGYKFDDLLSYYNNALKIGRKANFLKDYYKDLIEMRKITNG